MWVEKRRGCLKKEKEKVVIALLQSTIKQQDFITQLFTELTESIVIMLSVNIQIV